MRLLVPVFILLLAQHADAWHHADGPVKPAHKHHAVAVEINAVGDAMGAQTLASEHIATTHRKLVRSEASAPAPAPSVEKTVMTMEAEQADAGAGQQVLNKLKQDVDKLEKTERTEQSLADQLGKGSGATGSFEEEEEEEDANGAPGGTANSAPPPSGDSAAPSSSPSSSSRHHRKKSGSSPSPASPAPTAKSPAQALTTISKTDELEKSEVSSDVTSLKGILGQAEYDSTQSNAYMQKAQKEDQRLQQVGLLLEVSNEGPQKRLKTIKEIFEETNTDKLWRHGYHRYYETQLAPYRERDGLRILEIGAESGISLGAWLKYFTKPAAVQGVAYGVDATAAKVTACKLMPDQCDKLAIYSLDQSDKVALADMSAKNPEGWDIVIDDASHYPPHQIISFQHLWPKLRPGGLYVVEDIETSYVDTGSVYGYPLKGGIGRAPPTNAVEQFKRLADVVSRKHFNQPQFTAFEGVDHDVADVDFADGLIFVHKAPADPEWDTYPRKLAYGATNSKQSFMEYEKSIAAEHVEDKLRSDPFDKH